MFNTILEPVKNIGGTILTVGIIAVILMTSGKKNVTDLEKQIYGFQAQLCGQANENVDDAKCRIARNPSLTLEERKTKVNNLISSEVSDKKTELVKQTEDLEKILEKLK